MKNVLFSNKSGQLLNKNIKAWLQLKPQSVLLFPNSISFSQPKSGQSINLENKVDFNGAISGDVKKVRVNRILANQVFVLGNAKITGNKWSFSY